MNLDDTSAPECLWLLHEIEKKVILIGGDGISKLLCNRFHLHGILGQTTVSELDVFD